METVGGILMLIAGYAWKLWTDTRRSGRLRIGILIGSLLCVLSGSFGLVLFTKTNSAHMLEPNMMMSVLAVAIGFFLGGTMINVTNIIDHEFLRNYGPVRRFLFWSRNVTALMGNVFAGLVVIGIVVTMGVTNKVSAQEKRFNDKQAELEQKVNASDQKSVPQTTSHHHGHYGHHAHK